MLQISKQTGECYVVVHASHFVGSCIKESCPSSSEHEAHFELARLPSFDFGFLLQSQDVSA
jgi:hypothetical protein